MLINGVITIYNLIKSGNNTIIKGRHTMPAFIHGAKSESDNDNNIKDTDKYTIRIPETVVNHFIDYDSVNPKLGYYSVRKGDYCVIGSRNQNISSLSQLLNTYGDKVHKVVAVTDNRSNSKYTSHIKLVIK